VREERTAGRGRWGHRNRSRRQSLRSRLGVDGRLFLIWRGHRRSRRGHRPGSASHDQPTKHERPDPTHARSLSTATRKLVPTRRHPNRRPTGSVETGDVATRSCFTLNGPMAIATRPCQQDADQQAAEYGQDGACAFLLPFGPWVAKTSRRR
jgi:hypothetical protein